MKWLRKRHDDDAQKDEAAAPPPACEHVMLVPKWDSVGSMGHDDEVSSFRCDACGAEFSPAEGARLRATEAARVQQRIAG